MGRYENTSIKKSLVKRGKENQKSYNVQLIGPYIDKLNKRNKSTKGGIFSKFRKAH